MALANRSAMMRRTILGAGLVVGLAGVSAPARATDDGYLNVFSSVLGAVGLVPEEHSGPIEYRERAPLVLPPKRELAKPEPAGIARTAAWPQDPDVIARKKAEEEAKLPIPLINDKDSARPDSKTEMLRHRALSKADATPDYCRASQHSDAACRLSPEEMRRQDAKFRADNPRSGNTDVVTAGVEPDRDYLTQPPKGYLKPTRTVKATAEAPQPKRDESSPLSTLIHRQTDETESPNY